MSRIAEMFARKKQNVLNVYFTAGYPAINSTVDVMKALQESGADMIELGMPYSDPLADGPVIQQSSMIALNNGMTIRLLFEQLKDFRTSIHVPVILMGYMNPVLQYGFEKFCADASSVGIDGLILPDLPEFEFENWYAPILKKYDLDFVFLVTPDTSEQRVRRLDQMSSGFLYAVSSSSTTGSSGSTTGFVNYLGRLKSYNLKNPVLVGFGIRDKNSFKEACKHSSGAIIGTAFITALGQNGSIGDTTKSFISSILD